MIDETAVREAMLEDAAAIVAVLRQSITVLCVADHGNDAAALADWLANKTVENVERWLAQPGQHMVVATRAGAVCGVASMGAGGRVHLCYVDPGSVRRGVGRLLMGALEVHARALGLQRLHLDATITAERFYRAIGFVRTNDEARSYELLLR